MKQQIGKLVVGTNLPIYEWPNGLRQEAAL